MAESRRATPRATLAYPAPLIRATWLERPNRFVVVVRLADGRRARAHCPNPGRMTGCSEPGSPVWLARRASGGLPYRLEIVQAGPTLVGANPVRANAVVEAALAARAIPALAGWRVNGREVFTPDRTSRVDFVLRDRRGRRLWLEVKSVTLVVERAALFPDAVTARGRRHLQALAARVSAGERAATLYLVQRDDVDRVSPAATIDPAYAAACIAARAAGVALLGLGARVAPDGIRVLDPLPVVLNP